MRIYFVCALRDPRLTPSRSKDKECYEAIRAVGSDIAIGIADTGSEAFSDDSHLPSDIRAWLKSDKTTGIFYAWQ